ncbi:MAG TPA: hypothetical protein VH374_03205 [Polyangia bacterium]|nr:hypothetical protein [Polyangia bacterium]
MRRLYQRTSAPPRPQSIAGLAARDAFAQGTGQSFAEPPPPPAPRLTKPAVLLTPPQPVYPPQALAEKVSPT